MKKIYLLVLFVFGFSAFAQQKGISYQAVIINPNAVAAPGYNGTSIPLANKAICLSFQIVNGANQIEYQESQAITTDGYGMINVVIGTGRAGAGLVSSLDAVAWNQGNKKLVVGVNTDGVCSNYTEISNQLLNYSPYSLYAQNADIKDGYVTTAKLADGAVTDSKVAMGINPAKVGLGNVNNTSDANKPVSTATQTALNLKANVASPTFTGIVSGIDKAMVGLSTVDNTTDLNKPVSTATQTALNLKANVTDVTTSLGLKEDLSNKSSDIATDTSPTINYPTVKAVKDYVDANSGSGSGTIVDADTATKGKIKLAGDLAGTADLPTVPGLALKANTTDVTTSLALKEDVSNKSNATLGTSTTLYPTQNAVKTYVDTAITGATIVDADTATKGKIKLAGDLAGTADLPTVPGLALKAPLASPTFTGTVTAPIYASTPQSLTDAVTIAWDPANGLNASVTLGGNRTLSFTTTPTAGSYGTLVVTQDATGGRTLTLPSTANKVLGSTSTTTIALSTAANAKDILNFYYDGTNCYWNIGQGYGTAATSGSTNLATNVSGTLPVANGGTGATTLTGLIKGNGTNAMTAATAGTDYLAPTGSAASLTNFPTFNQNTTGTAANVSGTVAVANGGTGATTLTGIVKGNGTGVMTAAIAGTDYQAPITLTTTGTGAATFTGTTLNIPTPASGSSNAHFVGESYGGGVVFYTWDNGAHGLIVSLTDQCCNGSTIGKFSAGTATNTLAYNGSGGASTSNQTAFTTITGGGVGAGKKNTLLILASQGLGNGVKYAARYANEYSILSDGILYDDWYLGSVDEYHLLANNYPQVLANNSFTPLNGPNKDYWTSTEINLNEAFTVYIRTNSTTSNIFNVFPNAKSMFNNGGYGNVRAIRSF